MHKEKKETIIESERICKNQPRHKRSLSESSVSQGGRAPIFSLIQQILQFPGGLIVQTTLHDVWVWLRWSARTIRKTEDGNKEAGVGYIAIRRACVSDAHAHCHDRNRSSYTLYKLAIIEISSCRRTSSPHSFNHIYS